MRIVRFAAVLAAALSAATAFAQVKESINVNVVEVPVTVVDGSGNAVRGLTAANFKLFDQGKERPITAFDTIDLSVKQSAMTPMNPAARRNFMLLFDLSFSTPKSMARAQEAARSFVAKSVQARDLVGVGTIDVEHGFRLLTAFTTDRELVADAIANPASFKSADPLQLANETKVATLNTTLPDDALLARFPNAQGPGNRIRAANDAAERMVQMQRANTPYARARVEKEIDYLGALARTLRAVPGRKQIVFLSEGFDASLVSGRDAREAGQTGTQENDMVMRGEGYLVDSDTRFGNSTSQNFVSRMAQFFRGSDVVLHAIDIQGVRVENDVQTGARLNSNAGLPLLSDPTGGMFIRNANSIATDFDRMLKAQEFVYVLSFQVPATKPGNFHDLKVSVVNVPGRPQVFARAGYYEGGAQTPAERTLSNAEIILNDIAQSDVRMAGLAAAFPTGAGQAQVPVILELDGADVMKDLKGNAAGIEIYLYAFDAADGLVRDRLYQAINLDLKKVGDRLRSSGLKYYATLTLPPGKYAVKALVRVPETDRKGFVRADVVVPKAGEVAVLPAIFVDEHPSAVLVRGLSHATAADPFELGGERFIPAAGPHVKSGATPRFAVFVTNAQASEVTFDAPKVKFLGAAQGNGATALVMQVDDPNQTALDVTVRAKGTTETQKIALK